MKSQHRKDLEAHAKSIGISFTDATTDTAIMYAIEKQEAAIARATTGIPDPGPGEGRTNARVIWKNVHSSEGKHFKGETYHFLEDDFLMLDDKDAIKEVRETKKAKTEDKDAA